MPGIREAAGLALCLVGALLATACDAGEPDAGPPCDAARGDCFPVSDMGFYCTVLEARALLAQRRIEPSRLPAWADRGTTPDGSLRVYDFPATDPSGVSAARRQAQLTVGLETVADPGEMRRSERDCVRSLSADLDEAQQRIHDAEGGWYDDGSS